MFDEVPMTQEENDDEEFILTRGFACLMEFWTMSGLIVDVMGRWYTRWMKKSMDDLLMDGRMEELMNDV